MTSTEPTAPTEHHAGTGPPCDPLAPAPLRLTETPFDHSDGQPHLTGDRGVRLEAKTGYDSGRVFMTDFPTVWLAESGDVEIGDAGWVPAAAAVQWFRAMADRLAEKRQPPRGAEPNLLSAKLLMAMVDSGKSWQVDGAPHRVTGPLQVISAHEASLIAAQFLQGGF